MKKFDLPGAIVNGIVSICMGMAVVGCLGTAFDLAFFGFEALFACIVWAVITCVVLQLRRGWIAIPAGLLLWWLLLWMADTSDQFGMLLRTLFTVYSKAYGIQVPHGLLSYTDPNVTQAMAVIGGIVTVITGISLTRLRSGTLAVVAAGLSVIPCFFVTDTVPHEFFLFLLLSCSILAILTQNLRQREPRQANRLTAMLLVPVMLANILIFQTNPRQEYDRHPPDSLEELLTEWFDPLLRPFNPTLPSMPPLPSLPSLPDLDITSGQVDLKNVGPHRNGNDPVMKVQTDLKGVLYLRGKSYSAYNGLSWNTDDQSDATLQIQEEIFLQSSKNGGTFSFIQVETMSSKSFRYAAYYPAQRIALQDGAFHNPSMEKRYSMPIDPLRGDWQNVYRSLYPDMTLAELADYKPPMGCTQLPPDTLAEARQILRENGIDEDQHVLSAATQIADLVCGSARYSLYTPRMPSQETDFALWFLKSSETGYCIHFASAAVVLLRAAGIPARYVVGYVTSVDSDGIANVTEDQSHAWAEYWLPKIGWVMLEATPSEGWEPPVGTTEPTGPTTRPTIPTTRPTEPTTLPTQPTTEPTQPITMPPGPTTAPTDPTTGPTTAPTTEPTKPTTGHVDPTTAPTQPSETTPPSSTVPSTTTPGHTDPGKPKADLTWLWATLQSLLLLILAAVVLIGQWWLRLWLRKKWLYGGSANTQALRRWRYTKRLARLRRQDAPAALKELALKARFSQHTISDEELAAFDGYFDRSVTHLKSRNIFLRLIYRLIFAAY